MSFAVCLDDGALEYAGTDLRGLFAQRGNLRAARASGRCCATCVRFYREAPRDAARVGLMPLGDYLDAQRLRPRLPRRPSLPDGGGDLVDAGGARSADYPAAAFVRFCENHGLLQLGRRGPRWRTVTAAAAPMSQRLDARRSAIGVRLGAAASAVRARRATASSVATRDGGDRSASTRSCIATHADQALRLLRRCRAPTSAALLGAFRYSRNRAVLHSDPALMPRRRARLVELELRRRPRAAATRCASPTG